MPTWFVYMVRCGDGSLYTGIAIDVVKRIALHNAGKGAKYTRARLPVVLVWSAAMKSATDARKAEVDVKRLSKKEKEQLIGLHVRRG
ncbi:MAG: GIY-YIG nuclease family protein [Patescibacteria group bacterium]